MEYLRITAALERMRYRDADDVQTKGALNVLIYNLKSNLW